MKKRILSLLAGIGMTLSFLTGCNLVTRNDKNYYEAVVATVVYEDGTSTNITKRELITAYNSYGSNYETNYGYSREKAIDETLNSVVETYLTIKAVKDYYKTTGEEVFNNREKTYLWNSTYDAVLGNLKSYIDGYKEAEDASKEVADENKFSDYEAKVYLDLDVETNKLVIRKYTPATTIRETYEAKVDENGNYYDFEQTAFQTEMYNEMKQMWTTVGDEDSQKAWKAAFNKYCSIVKSQYSYKEFKDNDECFLFELNRVYEILRNNYYVEKYEVIYNTQKQQGVDISNISVSDVLNAYKKKVATDYTKYVLEEDSSYAENVLSDISNVNYILEDKDLENGASQYFYVAPIKISLDGDLSALDTQLKDRFISEEQYNALKAQLFDLNKANIEEIVDGEKTGNKISVNQLYNKIETAVAVGGNYLGDDSDKQLSYDKAAAYRDYFYNYNDDTTYFNADRNAVFGVDVDGNAIVGENFANDKIKDAVVALYNGGNAMVGDLSNVVVTDDAFYIFMYAGKVENLFTVNSVDFALVEGAVRVLASTRLNVFSSKTVFDSVYDGLSNDNFTVFQNMNMKALREKTQKIEIFADYLKDLYK